MSTPPWPSPPPPPQFRLARSRISPPNIGAIVLAVLLVAPALFVMLVGGFTGFSDSGNDPITPKMVVARQVLVTVPLPLAAVVVGVTIWLGVLRKTAVWVPLVGLGLMIALLVWHAQYAYGP